MNNRLSQLQVACDDVFSTRLFGRSLLGLSALALLGFATGSVMFANVPAPFEKLTGKVVADIEVKRITAEDVAQNTLPTQSEEKKPVEETIADEAPRADMTADSEDGLYETTPFGPLPIVRTTDLVSPFDAYKVRFIPKASTKGMIALVMIDYGLSDSLAKKAVLDLPRGISFVASPYATNLQSKITTARSYGHEVWLQAPIQSQDSTISDTGPLTILTGLKKEQNKLRMKNIMGKATGYVGIAMTTAPDFVEAPQNLDDIFHDIAERGLGFAQSDKADSVTPPLVISNPMPHAQGQFFLGADAKSQFTQIEAAALSGHKAVVFFPAYPALIPVIKDWKKSLLSKGIEFAPLSAIADHPEKNKK